MNISQTFIERPIATSLLMGAIALFGTVAYRSLPVSDLPNVDFPTLLITANLPGASPETMASAVATPLENQFSLIAGLNGMSSTNSQGSTLITLEFDLSRKLDGAAVDVQAAITQGAKLLPPNMPTPPTFTKVNPADQPILYLALTSDTLPLWTLDEYAETRIAQRISTISGVAQVQVLGQQKYAVHVQMDPHALAAHQIGLNEIQTALTNWNVNLPTGSIIGPQRAFTLMASGQLMNAAQYRPVVVAYRGGSPVRLEELGNVIDSVEDDKTASWFYKGGKSDRAIILAIQRQPGTNTITVTDGVKSLLPVFKNELPPAVHMDILYDRSDTIRESYKDVQFTMLLTLGLVVMVIFLFLRNVSATIIPSLALPFSIIGTFAVMYLLNYSLDNLSMMALILSIGFVVDDAIVMLENIVRHMEMGERPLLAAMRGSAEIGFTIVSMTLSLAAVFIPVLFMGGILGRLFKEFSVTICVAILISGVVSVTLTPMLCSRFLRVSALHAKKGFAGLLERGFAWLQRGYERSLAVVLRYRPVMIVVFVGVLAATIHMYRIIPTGFIPDQDNDSLGVSLRAAQGTSYYDMSRWTQQIADIVIKNPYVDSFYASVMGGSANTSRLMVQLVPRATRPLTAAQIAQQIRADTGRFAGFRSFVTLPPALQIGGRMGNQNYSIMLQALDTSELYTWAGRVEAAIVNEVTEVQDVSTDLEARSPRVDLTIDRDSAAAVGLNATQIENTLSTGFGSTWASTIYGPLSQYRVLLELDPKYQQSADSLKKVSFKTAGGVVPLDSVVSYKESVG